MDNTKQGLLMKHQNDGSLAELSFVCSNNALLPSGTSQPSLVPQLPCFLLSSTFPSLSFFFHSFFLYSSILVSSTHHEQLVAVFLTHFFASPEVKDFKPYQLYLEDNYLNQLFVETKLLSGSDTYAEEEEGAMDREERW